VATVGLTAVALAPDFEAGTTFRPAEAKQVSGFNEARGDTRLAGTLSRTKTRGVSTASGIVNYARAGGRLTP